MNIGRRSFEKASLFQKKKCLMTLGVEVGSRNRPQSEPKMVSKLESVPVLFFERYSVDFEVKIGRKK